MLDEDLIAGLKIKSRVAFDFLIQRYSLQIIKTLYKLQTKKGIATSGKIIIKRY
jgi:hypothetical protein